jgi:hypothetical protein
MILFGILIVLILLIIWRFTKRSKFVQERLFNLDNYNKLTTGKYVNPQTDSKEFCDLIDRDPVLKALEPTVYDYMCPSDCWPLLPELGTLSQTIDSHRFNRQFADSETAPVSEFLKKYRDYKNRCSGSGKPSTTGPIDRTYQSASGCESKNAGANLDNFCQSCWNTETNLLKLAASLEQDRSVLSGISPNDSRFEQYKTQWDLYTKGCSHDADDLWMPTNSDFAQPSNQIRRYPLNSHVDLTGVAIAQKIASKCQNFNDLVINGGQEANLVQKDQDWLLYCIDDNGQPLADPQTTLANAAKFQDLDSRIDQIPLSSETLQDFRTYCQAGQFLKSAKFTRVVNPDMSTKFAPLCDQFQCLSDKLYYQSTTPMATSSEIGLVNIYCQSGLKIKDCPQNVNGDPLYLETCFKPDGTYDQGNYVFRAKQFANLAPNVESLDPNGVINNLDLVSQYCNLANTMINQDKNLTPQNSTFWQSWCTIPGDCLSWEVQSKDQAKYLVGQITEVPIDKLQQYCYNTPIIKDQCPPPLFDIGLDTKFPQYCCYQGKCGTEAMNCNKDLANISQVYTPIQGITDRSTILRMATYFDQFCRMANRLATYCSRTEWQQTPEYQAAIKVNANYPYLL